MPESDLAVLRAEFDRLEATEAGEVLKLRPVGEFVEEVFFGWGYDTRGLIVGFNLPFDISRIARSHTYAKGAMRGGFSFTLAEGRPNVRVKHLSQRASFIDFAGKNGEDKNPDRGFFLDVKTLAAAMTSGSHSLESLAGLLGTTPKSPLDSYDGPLTPEMIRYGLNDVQATWECFAKLLARYEAYGLNAGVHALYSEASLGKAFLEAMDIKPWREIQPDFPPELLGQILSTYYGGRAEVHIRREITPVIHCDFRSMYPTVCTLMGLWWFVIARGVTWTDATEDVRRLVDTWTLDDLRRQETWRELTAIVQVRPSDHILPVRAAYDRGQPATSIGLNRLSSDEPMWFTLADVLTAKLLGGSAPEILQAIRFAPKPPQDGLRSITLEGAEVRPQRDDFYKLLIDQRGRLQDAEEAAAEADRAALGSAQQSLKILANSTSYGIFVELNVQQLDKLAKVTCYDHRGIGRPMTASKVEDPGRYFHPLLGTLITGAARLMLSLAERNALDQGLDWAFCDTDSLAIANTGGLSTEEFIRRVEIARAWFEPLNPYEKPGSILQLEKVNFPGGKKDAATLRPVNCLAISAKRYALFDRNEAGAPVIRKASAHGLGHLVAPYPDPERGKRIRRIGVELWQEDLWREIIAAFDRGRPDEVDFAGLRNFDQPAASRYAATNQTLLKWFDSYNETAAPSARVWPFNFLLSFQAKSQVEMAATEPEALSLPAWRRRAPNLASRYSSNLMKDPPPVFDRRTGEPVPWSWLKSIGRSLVRHHLHSEMKFRGGEDDQRGTLDRRRVHAWAVIPIGKEADNLEEREFLGEGDDDQVEWSMARQDRVRLLAGIEEVLQSRAVSDRTLIARAGVSRMTLLALGKGGRLTSHSLLKLAQAAEELRQEANQEAEMLGRWLTIAHEERDRAGGRNKLARALGVSAPYIGRVLNGEKPMTEELAERLKAHRARAGPMGASMSSSEQPKRADHKGQRQHRARSAR